MKNIGWNDEEGGYVPKIKGFTIKDP